MLPVFALVALVTLIPANIIVRQRSNVIRGRRDKSWDMFKDVSFLLMSAGK